VVRPRVTLPLHGTISLQGEVILLLLCLQKKANTGTFI
jgi:hypothetical protein